MHVTIASRRRKARAQNSIIDKEFHVVYKKISLVNENEFLC